MSVVSSRVSSVSSILKTPGVRSQLIRQQSRVYFKLPNNLRNILYNYEVGNGSKDYEDLVCILRNANIKDEDLLEFLTEVKQCISVLGPAHKLFIEALLHIKWTDRSKDVISAYKTFLEDLVCMHIQHTKYIVDNLVEQFKPENDAGKWEAGEHKEKDLERLNHIHDVLRKILHVVPMSFKLLLQSLRARFPYIAHGTHTHEVYVNALLGILEYAPHLRSDILSLIINRLIVLDVNIPRPDPDEDDEEDMETDDECGSTASVECSNENNKENLEHPIAQTLDVCMELVFEYIHKTCFIKGILNMESLRSLYFDILQSFESIILTTHASQYVQFIVFYICSFKPTLAEAFVEWLWQKASDPNVPSVMRQSSISYIASFLATATFVHSGLVKTMQYKLAKWIHLYIVAQDDSRCVENGKEHTVFYSVCQALFYLITARHKDFVHSKDGILHLQDLDLPKVVSCKLNPLKACLPDIVHNFADVTRTYQLAYCYTIIENNARSHLPILQASNTITNSHDSFYPFSMYDLKRSQERINSLICNSKVNTRHKVMGKCEERIADCMTD